MSEEMKKCPGCGRHCDLSAPSCPRGEAYARGETPEAREHNHEHGERRGRPEGEGFGRREWNGEGRHEHGDYEKREGRHDRGDFEKREGRCEHGDYEKQGERHGAHRRGFVGSSEYLALDTEKKLGALMSELGFLGRGTVGRGGQRKVLELLASGEMTQKALTEKLGIQPGSVSELVGKLERAGLIEKAENEADRRTMDLRLTEAGQASLEEGGEKEGSGASFAALSEDEQQQLLALLEKLHADWKARFHAGRGRHGGEERGEHRHGRKDGGR